jgi:DNA-binding transcriptional regulator YiaG
VKRLKPSKPWRQLDSTESARLKTARAKKRAMSPTPKMKSFAEKCKQLREAMGMDQAQFGRQIGVGGRTVSRWETTSGHLPSKKKMELFNELWDANRIEKGEPKPQINPSKFRK